MVEILVVIGLTSMLLIGAMSMLSSAIRVQSETLARQSMIDQASYVLDIMTKELRMARKDYFGECNAHLLVGADASPSIYGIGDAFDSNGKIYPNSRIWFLSQEDNNCIEIKFDPVSNTVKFGVFSTTTPKTPPEFDTGDRRPKGVPKFYPGGEIGNESFNYINLFSDDIIVDRFIMSFNDSTGQLQPMVTISMTLRHKIKTSLAPVNIQTTISSRNLNWNP
ncbi:MAG: hypothetical protein WC449_03560 [Candidatus Paceibacterota bacterium]